MALDKGLPSDACPDSWVWSGEKTSSNSMVVFSSEYGASLDLSDDERFSKVTSCTVASEHFQQYAGLRVPSHSFWRIGMTLENCELEEEETTSVEVVGLFGLYLDRETASFHVFQTFWNGIQ